jgi:glucuronide carrier protein
MNTSAEPPATDTVAVEEPPPARTLSAVQYLGYAGGDAANNLTFTLVSMFLLVYYTDVAGISAATAGTLLLVARVWGAFTDVLAGRLVDETNTRWGRFRPYFLSAGVPLMLLAVAVFSIPRGLSDTGTLVWAYVSYMLFYLVYSLVNIPYGSLAPAMTQLSDERAKLSSARSIGSSIAIVGLVVVVAPQVGHARDLQGSLTLTTIIFAVVGIALYAFLFATSRETVVRDTGKVGFGETLRGFARNKPLLMLCLSALFVLVGLFIMQTLQIYYARDVLGSADYTIVLTVLTTGLMLVVSPLIPRVVRTVGKKHGYVVAGLITAVGGVGIALSPPSVLALPLISFAVYGIGIAACQSLMWALQNDTVEYGEWKSGVRSEGINYAALSFSRKVGQGIGGALAAFGIGVGGYVAGAVTQSEGALRAIRWLTGFGPALFVGLGALLMLAYPLTEQRFQMIVLDLAARRGADTDEGEPVAAVDVVEVVDDVDRRM